ncbi:helicase-related protein [Kibdelosporangium aridum]|uniref:helicase-related protein n=1 Tax=Kibdelosporangium aridum TaxID=2030 RepID=UPI0035E69F17
MTGKAARDSVEAAVRREVFGPVPGETPRGKPLDCSGPSCTFDKKDDADGQFHDRDTLEEVLTRSDPLRRYGIGVLFSASAAATDMTAGDEPIVIPGLPENEDNPDQRPITVEGRLSQDQADSDDFDLSDANRRRPAAMAISFKVRVSAGGALKVAVTGAYYDRIKVTIPQVQPLEWWVRRPFELVGAVPGETILRDRNGIEAVPLSPVVREPRMTPTKIPAARVFSRAVPNEPGDDLRLVTVAVVNELPGNGPASTFFQMEFAVTAVDGLAIEPYLEAEHPDSDNEEKSIALLYRNRRTYAIGHGCAADWGGTGDVEWVRAEPVPSYEVESLTPDVFEEHADGTRTPVTVSMAALADGLPEGQAQVEQVLHLYTAWIAKREAEIPGLDTQSFREAAIRHMALCRKQLARMEEGWRLVRTEPLAARAFQLANHAMLYQQVRSRLKLREVVRDRDGIYRPQGAHPEARPGERDGMWRAFQIAFMLACLPELVDPAHKKRTLVDLIFFPTGGGKTEAYLGAAAISLIARRLRNKDDAGTDILMRYTLRLLTAQQFLRASSLICVLEDIRSKNEEELGISPFGIGVWLGGDSTPNTWNRAVKSLKRLQSDYTASNQFLLLKCPWCGTKMGPIRRSKGQDTIGYSEAGSNRVVLKCVDGECRFSDRRGLPVHVVDEDIYVSRPSIVIGTVDKFATMTWRPRAGSLFGLGDDGKRVFSPPSLIIQDELHLISGPLGSMVGLYEPVIADLTTDHRATDPIPAKIIASTATVRRYEDQIKGLFGRTEVALFPPHGIEEGHSFFAEPATLENGELAPGRKYLGIMWAADGSTQTVQARVAAATLQAGTAIPGESQDGYWTNLNFLNSLRELGNTVSLLESDVPDYLVGLKRRDGITPRWPRNTMELTSRRRSDEIPKAIEQLQIALPSDDCVDICLASNIIEVGVDIDRLGLMTIVGQPKTTAQYIQVSGRVGRRATVPGLVITIYGATKPRDRSHYERFRTYHQQLYAQVEPISVTPFAEPVLKRALHASAIARMRLLTPALEPYPFPRAEFAAAIDLIRARAAVADSGELAIFDYWVRERAHQWENGERTVWAASSFFDGDPKEGLLLPAGALPDPDNTSLAWDTPTSMRSVDAECRLKISQAYLQDTKPEETES